MELPREQATELPDLPHQFKGHISVDCEICGFAAFDPRHVAWEKAREQGRASDSTLRREIGS